jgi:signal transduction histidine kinase
MMSGGPATIFGAAVELRASSRPEPPVDARAPQGGDAHAIATTPGPETVNGAEPYPWPVTGEVSPRGLNALTDGFDPATARRMRPLALAAVVVVVAAASRTRPEPGLTGDHLAVFAALVVLAVGTLAAVRPLSATPAVQGAILAVVVVAAATLVGLQPNGPGFLGVFPAVVSAGLHLPTTRAALVAGLAGAAIGVAWAIGGGYHSVTGIVLNEFGIAAFFFLSLFLRRYREANDHARQLIFELNETRSAQAEAAALGERQRLAREMHDVLAHSLSGLALNLEGARLMAERSGADPLVTEAIHRAQRLAKTGLEEARDAIGMLRGDSLPDPARLAELAANFEVDTGVSCTFALEGPRRELASDVRLTVYRVAQEALTNIRKHAQPEGVDIRLVFEDTGTALTVEDHRSDGNHPAPGDGTGYGLTGMRERAELLGGTLTAAPTREGFRVTLWIPT